MHPLVALVRRWALQWLAAADPAVCEEILAPDYGILIGGHRLSGRDAYVDATMTQLQRFPGLGVCIHQLVCAPDQVAVRFTEHGASARLQGRTAAWGGIALFDWDGRRLTGCAAEEDYLARRRQLDDGVCDAIESPAPAPWNVEPGAADPGAEEVARAWLARGRLDGATLDDGWLGRPAPALLTDTTIEIGRLFSTGPDVAFHARQSGRYAGGLSGVTAAPGVPAAHHLAGIVTVRDGAVHSGRIVRDRLGLSRSLSDGRP